MSLPDRPERPLLGTWSALGLITAAGVAFGALFPLSRDRELRALASAPDMLALSYLELALARSPADAALRLRVAERTLDAGRFERARELLEPLLAEPELRPSAVALRLELEHRAWAALDGSEPGARAVALGRLEAALAALDPAELPATALEDVAARCAQMGAGARRAALLDHLARRDLLHAERLRAADTAWLEAGAPLAAAELHAARAFLRADAEGTDHATLAIERALASGQPLAALALFRQLRFVYGHEAAVLARGLEALAGVDDLEALSVGLDLLELRPEDAALRARVDALSAWTRRSLPVAPPPPPPSAPAPLRWGDAEEALITEASAPPPSGFADVIERASRLEGLGAPEQALTLIDAALSGALGAEPVLWELRASVERRLGLTRQALATLAHRDERFGPTATSVRRRAELALSLGQLAVARDLLASAPGGRDIVDERRLAALGWELGDLPSVRDSARVIAASDEATAADVRRLWLLEREAGELGASARAALRGFQRLRDPELWKLALYSAAEAKDDVLAGEVLAAADPRDPRLVADPESVRLSVGVRQERAHRALLQAEHARARAELAQSAELLARASADMPELTDAYGELHESQDRQSLELALAADDRPLLARMYPEQSQRLTPRERVFVLHRLGRDEEAIREAVSSLASGDVPAHDAGPLQADADALGAELPRQVSVLGGVVSMDELATARVGAAASHAFESGARLNGRVELTRLGSWQGLFAAGQDELAIELGAGLGESAISAGLVLLDGGAPRPSLRVEQGLYARGGLELDVAARFNERSFESPLLRTSGVEDELSARASLVFLERFTGTLRGSAKLYSGRDRQLLGGGATLDAALGRSWLVPGGLGNGGLRLAGYVAPRFSSEPGAIGDGASFFGLGASLARGQLSSAPVAGRRVSWLADATLGWLLPLAELGWSSRVGVGLSVLGADQLSITASASNVLSTLPGFAVYTLGADYALSRW